MNRSCVFLVSKFKLVNCWSDANSRDSSSIQQIILGAFQRRSKFYCFALLLVDNTDLTQLFVRHFVVTTLRYATCSRDSMGIPRRQPHRR